jgi:hypothetical protein
MDIEWISTRTIAAAIKLMQNALAHELHRPLIDIVTSYANDKYGCRIIALLDRYDERNLHFYIDKPQVPACPNYDIYWGKGDLGMRFEFSNDEVCKHVRKMSNRVLWDFACGESLPQELIDDIQRYHAFTLSTECIDEARQNLRRMISRVMGHANRES